MSDSLVNGARHLSLAPPIRPTSARNPSRESTLESAGQAADIFDLYGVEGDEDEQAVGGVRDSWQSSGEEALDKQVVGNNLLAAGETDPPDTPRSWEGPLGALNGIVDLGTPNGSSTPVRQPDQRWSSISNTNATATATATPDISVTDTSPVAAHAARDSTGLPISSTKIVAPRPDVPRRSSSLSQDHEDSHYHQVRHVSIASTSTSTSAPESPKKSLSFTNPDIARLSPRHTRKVRLSQATDTSMTHSLTPSSSTGATGTPLGSRNGSQSSIAASAQYPGEENDAYHVRSTYARLDTQGVHGDGWDPGVERTRGGPGGKRATVFTASKAGALGEQEKEFLAGVDRYGFVNEPHRNRSESRIALIPTAPLLRVPKLPSSSPLAGQPPAQPISAFSPSSDPGPSPRIPPSPRLDGGEEEKHRKKEDGRVGKWAKMMSIRKRDVGGNIEQWEWRKEGQGAKLPRRVYKGIPDRWRMAAWWTLAEDQVARYPGKGKAKRSAEDIGQDYRNTIDLPSSFDVQIDLDVPRTISGHTMFVTRYGTGQRNLWHVLHCFSQVCETCGYVQGMGPIAATLLCYFDPERAYTLLVRLHDVYGMHEIFEPGFPGLLEAFYVQERLMEWLMPDVYKSFVSANNGVIDEYDPLFKANSFAMIATEYDLLVVVGHEMQLRLWDALWLDGRDVMVMTSVALLWAFRDLLAAPNATFESILSLLSSYFVAEDEDALLLWIRKMLGLSGIKARMDGWRRDWQSLVREGKSETALL